MDKYYTPEIEEFYVGFEFEFLDQATWRGNNYKLSWCPLKEIESDISDNKIRVKYLDRKDMESLGWKHFKEYRSDVFSDVDYYKNNLHGLTHYHDTRTIIIWELHQHDLEGETYFNGTIKNKSELIKLHKQLGINVR